MLWIATVLCIKLLYVEIINSKIHKQHEESIICCTCFACGHRGAGPNYGISVFAGLRERVRWVDVRQQQRRQQLELYNGLTAHGGSYSCRMGSYSSATDYNQYIVSPALDESEEGLVMTFWYATMDYSSFGSSGIETFKVGYSTTTNDISAFTWGEAISTATATWEQYTVAIPAGATYVAINYWGDYAYYLLVDDISLVVPTMPIVSLPSSIVADAGIDVTITADYVGSDSGLSYTWASTMEAAGQATMSNVDNVLTINIPPLAPTRSPSPPPTPTAPLPPRPPSMCATAMESPCFHTSSDSTTAASTGPLAVAKASGSCRSMAASRSASAPIHMCSAA